MNRELFDYFAEDLLTERTVRPLVIIGASKVDALLLEVLRGFLLPKSSGPKDNDELLERDPGPLGTFSSRIKMCRRLGLIDPTFHSALEKLRSLRNASAHLVLFDDTKSPVREHFAEFKKSMTSRKSYSLIKERYFQNAPLSRIEEWQCLLLTVCALLEAVREQIRQTLGDKKSMRISAN
jgi:hypothetical protein